MNLKRIILVIIAIQILITSTGCSEIKSKENLLCKECNIIVISIVTLRADHVGAYGYSRNTTPNIDKLSEESILFEKAFVQSSMTFPSQMSIFTSLYPSDHNVKRIFVDSLDKSRITYPEILKETGYKNLWMGPSKSPHLDPSAGFGEGFDEFYRTNWSKAKELVANNSQLKFFMFIQDFKLHFPYLPERLRFNSLGEYNGSILDSKEKLDRVIFKDLSRIIVENYSKMEELFGEDNIEKHPEWFSGEYNTKTFREMFEYVYYNSSLKASTIFTQIRNGVYGKSYNNTNPGDYYHIQDLYDSEIYEIDSRVGGLLETLKDKMIFNKTIIIFMSEHGEHFEKEVASNRDFFSFRFDHLNDGVLNVPLIMYIPTAKRNQRIKDLVQSIDIAPTILDLVGLPRYNRFQGLSLVPLIEGKKDVKKNNYVYSEWQEIKVIRSKEWKLIERDGGNKTYELYNIIEDPLELNNIINKYPKVTYKLKNELNKWKEKQIRPKVIYNFPAWIDNETRKKIIETGYP